MISAKQVFQTICDTMDELHYHYDASPQDLDISADFSMDGHDTHLYAHVSPEKEFFAISLRYSFDFDGDAMTDAMIAVNAINFKIVIGTFICDIANGNVVFNFTERYPHISFGTTHIRDTLAIVLSTAKDCIDVFDAIAAGELDIEEFVNDIL